jgi:VanZ family protein
MRFIKLYWKALLWSFLILSACGINGESLPKVSFDFGIDKVAHFTLFLVQALLIYLPQKKHFVWAILLSSCYGILIEFMQMTIFVNRSFDYADMLADVFGAMMCYPIMLLWKWLRDRG